MQMTHLHEYLFTGTTGITTEIKASMNMHSKFSFFCKFQIYLLLFFI